MPTNDICTLQSTNCVYCSPLSEASPHSLSCQWTAVYVYVMGVACGVDVPTSADVKW